MTPRLRSSRPPILVLIACLVAALQLPQVRATASSAAPALRPGLGHRDVHGGFVGFYVTRSGTKVYCLSPSKRVPFRLTLSTVGRYPGVSPASAAALAYALSRWGDARSTSAAAVESQVLNTLAGNTAAVRERARGLSARVSRAVAAHVAEARAMRGPYSVRVSVPKALGPGQSGTGSVRVRTAGGHWLPGASVALRHTGNVSTARSTRTDRHGLGRFRFAVTDVGRVRITAAATALPATTLRMSHPGAGEQRMVGAAGRSSAHASTSFRRGVGGVAHRYECTTTCDGRPTLVLSACAPASTVASRVVYRVGRRTVIASFPASRTRHCRTTSTVGADGDHVIGLWQYRTRHGWSTAVRAAGAFVVDCPAPPKVGVTMSYDCARASVTIGLAQPGAGGSWTPFVNTSTHRMVLSISGSRSARVYAGPGHEALWTTSAPCGSHLQLSVRSGVQRVNGQWNVGPRAGVTTP